MLLQCYREIAAVVRDEGATTPAAEWFVDNFHIVDAVVRQVREDLPRGILPPAAQARGGPASRAILAYSAWPGPSSRTPTADSSPRPFSASSARFQRVQPLTIGELWAVPIALRIVLVENLRRLAEGIVRGRIARHEADALANELLGLGGRTARPLAFQGLDASSMSSAFTVELVQRLREQDPQSTPALRWLNAQLSTLGRSPDELVQVEHQNQAAMNVTVRNVITSMRIMSTLDWADFFESVSLVDDMLRADTDFGAMDFTTRDQYRHAIEDLARGSARAELEVTRLAIAAAKRPAPAAPETGAPPADRSADPGYYLISEGRPALEKEIGYRVPAARWLRRAFRTSATPRYVATVVVVTTLLLAPPLFITHASGMTLAALVLLAFLAAIPASDLSVALVNRAVMAVLGPRSLPRLELHDGVPPSLRTLVVVPTLLTSEADIDEQVSRLEIHFLANPDGDLHFALLSDWRDALTETRPEDARLLGGRHRRHRAAQRTQWPRAGRRRAFPPAPPQTALERGRGHMDGLGAQAREARRAQPPAHGRERHDIHRDRRAHAGGAPGSALRDHPRCRHAPAPRSRGPPRRHDGPPPEPARLRRAIAARGRGLRRPPAAGHTNHTPRAGPVPLPADLRGARRDRPLRGRGLGRLPGSSRRRLLYREGHLRRGRLHRGAGGPGARELPAEPRSLRGDLRPGGPRHRHRAVRGVPHRLRGRGRPPVPLGARRLAAAPVDHQGRRRRRHATRMAPAHRGVEDRRQPPADPLAAGRVAHSRRGLDSSARPRADVDDLRAGHPRAPRAPAGARRDRPQATRHLQADPHPRRGPELRPRGSPDRPRPHLPGPPGVADGRRDRADARPCLPDPPPAARMDDRGPGRVGPLPRRHRRVPPHARRPHPRRRGRAPRRRDPTGGRGDRGAVPPAVGALPPGGPLGEPAPAPVADAAALSRGPHGPPLDRASYLAVLRGLRRPRRHLPASRQLPGRSEAGPRPPHLSHQHRALPALGGRRTRLRLARYPRHPRSSRRDAGHDAPPRALPGPLLQLVRHRRSSSARAPLRVHRRQRQPRGPPSRARKRLPPRRPLPAAGAGSARRTPGRGGPRRRRAARRPRRRPPHPDRHRAQPRRDHRESSPPRFTSSRRAGRSGPPASVSSPATPTRSWTSRAR